MKFELTINELGRLLKKLGDEYKLELMTKMELSGGWMTMHGEATIESIPAESVGCKSKSNNIISIRVKSNDSEHGTSLKLTGAKNLKFKIDVSSTRYKELAPGKLTLNQIKVNDEECKLRIDENIIFKIPGTVEEVINFIEK